jgi:hypothetical protein
MSRQRWKKRTRGTEAPPEFSSFCRGIFLARRDMTVKF